MSERDLTQAEIVALLKDLGADLDSRGLRAELFVVGGAAMSLAYNTRRTTRDVDGIFEPKTEVYRAAARVGADHGLPEGWLNDAVKRLLPGPDPQPRHVLSAPGVRVSVPQPEYLLALKVAAARVMRDEEDIRVLVALCGARYAEDVFEIIERVWGPHHRLLPKSQYLIEEIVPLRSAPKPSAQQRVVAWWNRQRAAQGARAAQRATRRASTPDRSPRAPRCGMPTRGGGSCRNRAGSCPHHR